MPPPGCFPFGPTPITYVTKGTRGSVKDLHLLRGFQMRLCSRPSCLESLSLPLSLSFAHLIPLSLPVSLSLLPRLFLQASQGSPPSGTSQGKTRLMSSALTPFSSPLSVGGEGSGCCFSFFSQELPSHTLSLSGLHYCGKAPRPPRGLVPGPSHLMLSEKASTPNLETQ